jgi:magnesium transporter
MTNVLLLPELRSMLAEEDHEGLTALMTELHPATVADWTEGLTVEETWKVFNHAGIDRQAQVFEFFPIQKQVDMVTGAGRERMSRLIEAMAHDERVVLLKRLDPEVVESLLPLVAKADRQDIRTLLSYPEHSAGSVMTTEYATLTTDLTVSEAISRLRLQATSAETIYYVYVVDSERHLVGMVSLHELILARPTARIESIMQREVISVPVDADQEDVAQTMARYDFLALPVVDGENRIVGIVTHDDVIDVVVQEATEDALRMGGVGSMVEHYLDAPFLTLWRKRSGWLACLFVAEMFTFSALAHFQSAIEKIIALSLFVPLCISTGGNSGSQAATLITRAMALRQIRPSDWSRVIRHELIMGLALGLTLGAIGFIRVFVTPAHWLGLAASEQLMLAFVIAQAVAAICLWGTLVGSTLPLVFSRLGFDPGYASSPFVATFVDVTGIVIYFSIATIWLLR